MARLFKFNNRVAYALITLILTLSLILSTTPVFAIPGDLDTSFNGDGIALHYGAAGGNYDYARTIFVNNNDEIFMTGTSRASNHVDLELAIWKMDSNGDLDTSFSSDGYHTIASYNSIPVQGGYGIIEDSEDRIVVVGETENAGQTQYVFAVWRFNADGTLDTSFAGDGVYSSAETSGASARATDVLVDENDEIYVLCKYSGGMSIWKFNEDGTLDTSFDSDGIMVNKGVGTSEAYAYDMDMDSEGRLVVAGRSYNTSQSRWEPTVWRVDTDGSMDTSFSGDGVDGYYPTTGYPEHQRANGVAVGPNDTVALTGQVVQEIGGGALVADAFVILYEEDGDRDTSFSGDGVALSGYSTGLKYNANGYAIEFDENANLVVVGNGYDSGQPKDMIVWRYLPDGSLDEDFGDEGVVLESTGQYGAGGAFNNDSLEINSDGKILAAGQKMISYVQYATIWQYRGGEVDSVGVDVRPGECENLVDVDSTGVLTVAINGTASFDVTDIDPDSVMLEDASPLQSFVQDMSYSGDCDEPTDTYDDLIVRFRISDLPASLQSLSTGQTADLDLTADYYNNGSIGGTDTIEVIND